MKEHTTIVIGCSTDRDYSVLLPLTCLLWRDHIGYEPLALLVGSESDWKNIPRCNLTLEALIQHNIPHRFIGRAEGYPDHTTAQNCRQHASALTEIDDKTWIVPADADLWPLRRAYYHQHEGTKHKAVLYYANGDHFTSKQDVLQRSREGLGSQTIPTCHAAMRASDWRTIYALAPGDVAGSIKKSLDAWLPSRTGRAASFSLWMSDQQLMTEAFCHQNWFPSQVLMIERRGHPPLDRLCRSVPELWQDGFDPARWVDAHMHKSPDSDAHWPWAEAIVHVLLPQLSSWARDYRAEYVRRS